jgi:hypothetical protein
LTIVRSAKSDRSTCHGGSHYSPGRGVAGLFHGRQPHCGTRNPTLRPDPPCPAGQQAVARGKPRTAAGAYTALLRGARAYRSSPSAQKPISMAIGNAHASQMIRARSIIACTPCPQRWCGAVGAYVEPMHLLIAIAIGQRAYDFRLTQAARPLSEPGTSRTQHSRWQKTRRTQLPAI